MRWLFGRRLLSRLLLLQHLLGEARLRGTFHFERRDSRGDITHQAHHFLNRDVLHSMRLADGRWLARGGVARRASAPRYERVGAVRVLGANRAAGRRYLPEHLLSPLFLALHDVAYHVRSPFELKEALAALAALTSGEGLLAVLIDGPHRTKAAESSGASTRFELIGPAAARGSEHGGGPFPHFLIQRSPVFR
jgi:hypothetical protein